MREAALLFRNCGVARCSNDFSENADVLVLGWFLVEALFAVLGRVAKHLRVWLIVESDEGEGNVGGCGDFCDAWRSAREQEQNA